VALNHPKGARRAPRDLDVPPIFSAELERVPRDALPRRGMPPDAAYQSVVNISTNVAFGWWIRSIHKWAATGMVILVFVHMLRVFFTTAYKRPRELNWLSGVVLLGVTMAFGFTGYLLPWDQKAYWATRVGTDIAGSTPFIGHFLLVSLRGGENITGATLGRFFTLHVLVLPVVIAVFLGAHFFMIRRHGISGKL